MSFQSFIDFPVDDLSPEAERAYVMGFEGGKLLADLQHTRGEGLVGQSLHLESAELVMRIGEAVGLRIYAEPVDDTWMVIARVEEEEERGG